MSVCVCVKMFSVINALRMKIQALIFKKRQIYCSHETMGRHINVSQLYRLFTSHRTLRYTAMHFEITVLVIKFATNFVYFKV